MQFNQVIEVLNHFSQDKLKGELAHHEIAPYRVNYTKPNPTSIPPKKAAVLVLLYPIKNSTHFALIQRPQYDGKHSGQISFPGGKWEQEDNSLLETAIREAWEETNIKKEEVKIVGELSQIYIPPSNFQVTPVLALSNSRPDFIPDNREVDEIFEIELSDLITPHSLSEKKINLSKGKTLTTPYFNFQSKTIWGATAMILNELKHFILDHK